MCDIAITNNIAIDNWMIKEKDAQIRYKILCTSLILDIFLFFFAFLLDNTFISLLFFA